MGNIAVMRKGVTEYFPRHKVFILKIGYIYSGMS